MSDPLPLPVAGDADDQARFGKTLRTLLERLRKVRYDRDDIHQFAAFAMPLASRSQSQLFQDLWALWMSGQKRGGFFVEFGAADGVRLSNTYLLEKEWGWRGILAEPNPRFAASLAKHRRCAVSGKCVYARSGETVELLIAQEGELSRIAGLDPEDAAEGGRRVDDVAQVQTISLNDLLTEFKAPRRIDFMSIDTEGAELQILQAFDFDRWDIGAIAVEHNYRPDRAEIGALLTAQGFRNVWPTMSRFDDWYVRDDLRG